MLNMILIGDSDWFFKIVFVFVFATAIYIFFTVFRQISRHQKNFDNVSNSASKIINMALEKAQKDMEDDGPIYCEYCGSVINKKTMRCDHCMAPFKSNK